MSKFASGQDEANPCSIGYGERALTTHLALAGYITSQLALVNNQPFDLTLDSLGLERISSTLFPVFSPTRPSLSPRRDEEAAPKRSKINCASRKT